MAYMILGLQATQMYHQHCCVPVILTFDRTMHVYYNADTFSKYLATFVYCYCQECLHCNNYEVNFEVFAA